MPSPAYILIFSETEDPTTYSKLNLTAHEIKIWDKYCNSRVYISVVYSKHTQKNFKALFPIHSWFSTMINSKKFEKR